MPATSGGIHSHDDVVSICMKSKYSVQPITYTTRVCMCMLVCVEKLSLLVNAQLALTVTFQDENKIYGDHKGHSTVLITALGSWEKLVSCGLTRTTILRKPITQTTLSYL